jgi:hypothetical protein
VSKRSENTTESITGKREKGGGSEEDTGADAAVCRGRNGVLVGGKRGKTGERRGKEKKFKNIFCNVVMQDGCKISKRSICVSCLPNKVK